MYPEYVLLYNVCRLVSFEKAPFANVKPDISFGKDSQFGNNLAAFAKSPEVYFSNALLIFFPPL